MLLLCESEIVKNITRRKRDISKEEIKKRKRKVRIISQANNNIYCLQNIIKMRENTSRDIGNHFS
jgi:hypothetical protein